MADSPFTKEIIKAISEGRNVIRGLPDPEADVDSLYLTVRGLKEAVETLMRSRNDVGESAVRVKELEPIFSVIEYLIGEANGESINPTNPDFDGTHGSLTGVTADQHHNRIHSLFSLDHDDMNLTDTRAAGSAIIWDGTQYNHVVVPVIDTAQAVIDPGNTAQVWGFAVSAAAKAAKLLLRVTDDTNNLTRASEVRLVTNDVDVFTTHYGYAGDVILYKVTGSLVGGECGIEITNNHSETINVEALPVITAN